MKVVCETASKTGVVVVFGEISTKAQLHYQEVISNAIKDIGYDDSFKGFVYKSATSSSRSPILPRASTTAHPRTTVPVMGASCSAMLPTRLPSICRLPSCWPTSLILRWPRHAASACFLGSKTQVTVEYKKRGGATIPLRVDTVVISTQHAEEISTEELRKDFLEKIIRGVIPKNLLDNRTIYHVRN